MTKKTDAPAKAKPESPSRWVRFAVDFDYTWPSRAMTQYRAGMELRVPGVVADLAVEVLAAEEIEPPKGSESALDNPDNSQ